METLERRLDIAREEAAKYKKAARLWKTRFEQEKRARCVCVCVCVMMYVCGGREFLGLSMVTCNHKMIISHDCHMTII